MLECGADMKMCMSFPCGNNGMANPGAYNLYRTPLQIAQGPTQQVLANWARLASERRCYGFKESWLYARLPKWSIKTHNEFPLLFRKQAIALVCVERTTKQARDDVFPLLIQMMDVHIHEFIFGKSEIRFNDTSHVSNVTYAQHSLRAPY
jgi:hypothetical protein